MIRAIRLQSGDDMPMTIPFVTRNDRDVILDIIERHIGDVPRHALRIDDDDYTWFDDPDQLLYRLDTWLEQQVRRRDTSIVRWWCDGRWITITALMFDDERIAA